MQYTGPYNDGIAYTKDPAGYFYRGQLVTLEYGWMEESDILGMTVKYWTCGQTGVTFGSLNKLKLLRFFSENYKVQFQLNHKKALKIWDIFGVS